jgi:hypothetical protein
LKLVPLCCAQIATETLLNLLRALGPFQRHIIETAKQYRKI